MGLPVNRTFKNSLLEDIRLGFQYFPLGNISSAAVPFNNTGLTTADVSISGGNTITVNAAGAGVYDIKYSVIAEHGNNNFELNISGVLQPNTLYANQVGTTQTQGWAILRFNNGDTLTLQNTNGTAVSLSGIGVTASIVLIKLSV